MVVRHDMCFIVIYLCHVVGSYYFASAFLHRSIMSHMLLYHVVYMSHIWMQGVRHG